MKNEERINIRVVLHDMLSKPAKKIREEQEALRESAEDAQKAQENLGDALDDTGKALDENSKAIDDNNDLGKESVEVGEKRAEASKKTAESTDADTVAEKQNVTGKKKSNRETKKSTGILNRLTGQFKKSARGALNFGTNYLTFVGMFRSLIQTDLAPAIPVLLTGISALGASAVAFLGPLGKLGANLVHILPLYATMGTLMGVTTMAFANMGDAISALNDPSATIEEINEALSKLGPNAQTGARALAKIVKSFKAISGAVQETYWGGGMTDALTKFAGQYMPILEKGLINASKHMREASIHSMKLFGGDREQKAFTRVLDGAGRSAGKIGIVFGELARVLLLVTDSAMPVFEDLLDHFATSLNDIGDNIDSEALTAFFRESGKMAKGFWEGLKDIGGALRNMAKASKPLTDHLSKGLGNILDKWNKWTGSDEGQAEMSKFFKDMIPNMDAIGNLIGSIWDMFKELGNSEWFAPFVNDIADNVIPQISKIIKQLSDNLLPVFIRVSEAFSDFTEGQDITVVQPLIDILTAVGNGVAWLLEQLGGMSPDKKELLTYLGGLMLIGVPVVGILFKLIRVFKFLMPVFGFVGRVIGFVGRAFGGLFKAIGELTKNTKLGSFFSKLFGWFGKLGGKGGTGLLTGGLKMLGKRMIMLAGPVGLVIGILMMIWDVLKFLYNKFEWFRTAVDSVVNFIVVGFQSWLATWRDEIVPGFKTNIDKMVEWFRNIPNVIADVVTRAGAWWSGLITTLKVKIVGGIVQFIATSKAKFNGINAGIAVTLANVRARWNGLVAWLKRTIVGGFVNFIAKSNAKFNGIVSGIVGTITNVKARWNGLIAWLKKTVVGGFVSFIAKSVNAFSKMGKGIGEAMDKIKSAAKKPVDFVINTVYNKGIVPMWNKIAGTFGLTKLNTVATGGGGGGGGKSTGGKQLNNRFADGGVLPGYTPGKDVHHFTSPTGGNLHLSGGEAIMRPEFTRLVGGKSGVDALNGMAKKGHLNQAFAKGGVNALNSMSTKGNPNQAFAKGGVTEFAGDLGNKIGSGAKNLWGKAKDIGGTVLGGAKKVADVIGSFVSDPVGAITTLVKKPAEALYGSIPNSGSTFASGMLEIPKKAISSLIKNAKNKVSGFFQPDSMEGGGGGGATHMGPPPGGGAWRRPSHGRVSQRYGVPGVLSGYPHAGIDIAGGGKTYATADGTVYRTGSGILGGRSGLGIGLSHGGGMFSYYGHNPVGGIQVSPGQKVKAGQHIGYQGATGNVTGTHLHFELHKGGWGKNVNPASLGVFDTGGWLMPGQMAVNKSGSPEPILNGEQFGWLKSVATQGVTNGNVGYAGSPEYMGASSGGTTTVIQEAPTYVDIKIDASKIDDPTELARLLRTELKKIERDKKERK